MREVNFTGKFKRDLKRELKGNNNKNVEEVLDFVINLLASDLQLPAKFLDHALKGNHIGSRECHLKSNLLLIYRKIGKEILEVEQLGSHSEIL